MDLNIGKHCSLSLCKQLGMEVIVLFAPVVVEFDAESRFVAPSSFCIFLPLIQAG